MAPAKPVLQPLQTPKNAAFPSEFRGGPRSAVNSIKQEDAALSTPITPPVAYTDFLKALTPVFASPVSPGSGYPRFHPPKKTGSFSQPSTATTASFSTADIKSPKSPNGPLSAKSPNTKRRMKIAPVKTSFSTFSPTAPSPKSATILQSPFSPSDWRVTQYIETPRSACGKYVSVKQVVTRTVTYKRTQLDPAPKGKRRRTSESKESSKESSKETSRRRRSSSSACKTKEPASS